MKSIDQIPCPVMVSDLDGHILEINRKLLEIVGGEPSNWLGQPMNKLVSVPSRIFLQTHVWPLLFRDGQVQEIKLQMLGAQGAEVPVLCDCQRDMQGATPCYWWVLFVSKERSRFEGELLQAKKRVETALNELQISQSALKQSLCDKEALIKEVHHRVKNNLQVIASLLRLESGRSQAPEVKSVLGDMRNRIGTMAALHESLYRSESSATVNLGNYLRQLSIQAFQSQATGSDGIGLQHQLESVLVGMDQAVTCGLLVNELISNCFKHGFPAGASGFVRVDLHPLNTAGHWRLSVYDTGVGLGDDFEDKRKNSLGLQLADGLAKQIGGALEIATNGGQGVAFSVDFQAKGAEQPAVGGGPAPATRS